MSLQIKTKNTQFFFITSLEFICVFKFSFTFCSTSLKASRNSFIKFSFYFFTQLFFFFFCAHNFFLFFFSNPSKFILSSIYNLIFSFFIKKKPFLFLLELLWWTRKLFGIKIWIAVDSLTRWRSHFITECRNNSWIAGYSGGNLIDWRCWIWWLWISLHRSDDFFDTFCD